MTSSTINIVIQLNKTETTHSNMLNLSEKTVKVFFFGGGATF